MEIFLDTFLLTGALGDLRRGLLIADAEALLGLPDAVGGTSRKYREPSILVYGSVELSFRPQPPRTLTSLNWQAGERGPFRLSPTCHIVDWAFTPEWTFERVAHYLHNRDLTYDYTTELGSEASPPWILLASGLQITFYRGLLHSISG